MTYIENSGVLVKSPVRIKVEKTFRQGVEIDQNQWISSKELVLKECSGLVLHALFLEAEKKGNSISYSRTLTIEISE